MIRDAIEIPGGNGAIEDFPVLPQLLRDGIVINVGKEPQRTVCSGFARLTKLSYTSVLCVPGTDQQKELLTEIAAEEANGDKTLALPADVALEIRDGRSADAAGRVSLCRARVLCHRVTRLLQQGPAKTYCSADFRKLDNIFHPPSSGTPRKPKHVSFQPVLAQTGEFTASASASAQATIPESGPVVEKPPVVAPTPALHPTPAAATHKPERRPRSLRRTLPAKPPKSKIRNIGQRSRTRWKC